MTADLFLRPRRGECLEADMASMSVEDLKCVMRDLTAQLDQVMTRFLPAGARLDDANDIEIPDDEPMYVAQVAGVDPAPTPVNPDLPEPAGAGAGAPFSTSAPVTAYHWAHEA